MGHLPTTWPASSSPLVTDLLSGGVREARVLAAFPTALYLHAGRHEDVLPVLTHDAVALPTGLCLPRRSGQVAWGVSVGEQVLVGDGRVWLPGATVVSVRTRRPARVRWGTQPGPAAYPLAQADGPLGALAGEVVRSALEDGPVRALVTGLVGAGQGLTPSGDDALCGVLLALRAGGAVAAHRRVADAVRELTHTTTSLSASLLLAALDGYAVPDVVRLVALLTSGPKDWHVPPQPADSGVLRPSCRSVDTAVGDALSRVLAIGHSSGADLVAGLAGALEALHSHTSHDSGLSSNQEGARRA